MVIAINEIETGMVLAEPVLSRNVQVLLNAGTELTDRHKHIFKTRGIVMISIRDKDDIEIVISQQIKDQAKELFKQQLLDIPTHFLEKEIMKIAVDNLASKLAKEQA